MERASLRYNVSQRGIEPMATTMVHVRVDEKTKEKAAKTLAGMGISVSDAVRMLLVRVAAEKALPFEVRVPNATTVKAMRAAPQPIIAAVDGVCAGAGAIAAMASDIRIGTARAKVSFLFNRVGLAGCDMGACAL